MFNGKWNQQIYYETLDTWLETLGIVKMRSKIRKPSDHSSVMHFGVFTEVNITLGKEKKLPFAGEVITWKTRILPRLQQDTQL